MAEISFDAAVSLPCRAAECAEGRRAGRRRGDRITQRINRQLGYWPARYSP